MIIIATKKQNLNILILFPTNFRNKMRTDFLKLLWLVVSIGLVAANPDAKRLYSNLLANYDRYKNRMSNNKRI